MLTYKAPIAGRAKRRTSLRYKEREEIEVEVTNGADLARILEGLGLRPSFRYEKYRTKYTLKNLPRLEVDLDETPAGISWNSKGLAAKSTAPRACLAMAHPITIPVPTGICTRNIAVAGE